MKKFLSSLTDSKALLWIGKSVKKQWIPIALLTLLNILLASASIAVSYMLKNVINSATGVYGMDVSQRMQNIAFWGVMFACVVLSQFAMSIFSNHLVFRITARITIDLKTSLYERMLHKSYAQITKFHTGEMLNRLNNDVGTISSAITQLIPGVVYVSSKLIGIFIVLFTIDPLFTLLFLCVGIFAFLVTSFFKKWMKDYHKQIFETDGKVRSFMQETLSSLLVIKIFNAEDKVVETASDLQEINYKRKKKRNIISITTQSLFSLAFYSAYIFGLVYCAIKIAHNDPIVTYGTLSQVLSLISQISVPIRSMTSVIPTYFGAIASAERIMEFEDMDDEPVVNESQIDLKALYDNLSSIEFKDIVFRYDRDIIFNHTDLSVYPGDLIVMTGISGIGKSTLTKLMLGVFPLEEGEIYLKLKDGSQVSIDRNIRRMFSYVPQGNFLLSGTLRENISFIKSDATDEEIWEAVHFACADFIHDLPQGLDTVIGEKGLGLSEGQVQRVAIARAILSGAPVIILDEATSALDETTELRLLENIKELTNKTCILISHKKAANAVCNKEVRIIDGKIVVIENNGNSET